jgi:hypothetical protein
MALAGLLGPVKAAKTRSPTTITSTTNLPRRILPRRTLLSLLIHPMAEPTKDTTDNNSKASSFSNLNLHTAAVVMTSTLHLLVRHQERVVMVSFDKRPAPR